MKKEIPFTDFGGEGEVIHFAHANGFPPNVYKTLVSHFTDTNYLIGIEARPLWLGHHPNDFKSWLTATEDLIEFLDGKNLKGIVAMGHSFGAICTLLAAVKRPDLFKQLVLIEPVILPKWYYPLTAILPEFIVKKINPVVEKTLNRTDEWSSKQAVFNQFRKKSVFSKIDDENLWNYVNAATTTFQGKEQLTFTKEWEAQIYLTITNPWGALKEIDIPFLVIRGETSDTIFPNVWKQIKQSNPKGTYVEMKDCGHLVPLEKPTELAEIIKNFLSQNW